MELRRLPIIKLWDRILVPMQGEITDELAEQLSTEVLKIIYASGARGLVLDLTGVWIMDSHLCSVISNLAAAAKLMGTPTIISGLSPEIAMTLQTMGVELVAVQTALSLEQALLMLGLEVRREEEDDDDDEDEDHHQAHGTKEKRDHAGTEGSRAEARRGARPARLRFSDS
jgi:rsbT antagonist protein RsbS